MINYKSFLHFVKLDLSDGSDFCVFTRGTRSRVVGMNQNYSAFSGQQMPVSVNQNVNMVPQGGQMYPGSGGTFGQAQPGQQPGPGQPRPEYMNQGTVPAGVQRNMMQQPVVRPAYMQASLSKKK